MSQDITAFLVGKNAELYSDAEYLHAYLTQKSNTCADAGFAVSMVETFGELRLMAEEQADKHPQSFFNRKKALPLEIPIFNDFVTGRVKDTEPPKRLISLIAENHYSILSALISKKRKVLQRERQKVHLSQAQQLDTHCLRWLMQQPGISAAQKGGAKQRIMAVVRQETHNTLENRVLKDFLIRACRLAKRYLEEYQGKYQGAKRIQAVQHLLSMMTHALREPEMKEIAALKTLPTPNYVLQQDALYHVLWELYLRVIRQAQMVELAWSKRPYLFADLVKSWLIGPIAYMGNFAFDTHPLRVFHAALTTRELPKEKGFFEGTFWTSVFRIGNSGILVMEALRDDTLILRWQTSEHRKKERILRMAYIPAGIKQISIPESDEAYLLFCSNETEITGEGDTDIFRTSSQGMFELEFPKFIDNILRELIS